MKIQKLKIPLVLIFLAFIIWLLSDCVSSTLSGQQDQFSFTLPDRRQIVYQPVDSLLVIEFNDTLSAAKKSIIIKELGVSFLPIQIRNNQSIQDLNKSTLVLRNSTVQYATLVQKILRNYREAIRGILPAFELDKRLCYIRPTTFGISFYGDVHQDSVFALLQKYQLTLHDKEKIEANPFPFYVMRLAYVKTKSHANLF